MVALAFAGFVLRALYVLAVTRHDALVGDQLYYSGQAYLDAIGRWFVQPFAEHQPGADHPPLTVAALTPITWLLRNGPYVSGQRWFTVAVGSANIVLIALVARRFVGSRTALVAAALAAVHAALWMGDALILSEPYTIAAICALFLAADRLAERPGRGRAVLAGLVAGLTILGRAEMALLVVVLLGPWAWRALRRGAPRRRAALGEVALVAAGAAVLVGPWVAWNMTRFQDRVLISSNDGFTLLGANCQPAYYGRTIGSYQIGCALAPEIPPEWDSSQASALRTRLAVRYARDHAGRLPLVAAARLGRLWLVVDPAAEVDNGPGEGRPRWAMWIGVAQFWALVPLAVAGWARIDRSRRWPLLSLPAVATFTGVLIAAYWRIRVPADIALVILSAAGIVRLIDRRARRTGQPDALIVER